MKNVTLKFRNIIAALGILMLSVSMTSCGLVDWLLKEEAPAAQQEHHEEAGEQTGSTGGTNRETPESQDGINLPSASTGAKSATVMVYMNGSDLETEEGSATDDLLEMIDSGVGKNVNVIIQTMGTKEWQNNKISADTAQTWKVENEDLVLLRDNLGQLDCTSKKTLSEFIDFCSTSYPADRYLFLFWDHGGGPVYGFGVDEWQDPDASLTIDEMAQAFSEHAGIHFDMIGMDCCIMADLETCFALAPFCDYTVLSEDFESGLGWYYKDWMGQLEKNPGMTTPMLGKAIVDGMVQENELSEYGGSSCMGLFKESAVQQLFTDWITYAYRNEDALLATNFSKLHKSKAGGRNGSRAEWGMDDYDVTLDEYYITDILAIVESVDKDSDPARNLVKSLKECVVYSGHTTDKNELTGLAVSLPYGEADFYDQMRDVYGALGIDKDYIDWLAMFVTSSNAGNYYDYDNFENSWEGWECVGGDCGSYEDEDDWTYDYEDGLWYLYEDGVLYFYDEESDTTGYYDDTDDTYYYYDETDDMYYGFDDTYGMYDYYDGTDDMWCGY
ncbi:MAG: hypothetical protein IJJ13_07720 [Lachnospiraceae bacterium]|nr:hypothetical protein [Lachnospiraceae bacterium]